MLLATAAVTTTNPTDLERTGGQGASLTVDPSRRNQFWNAESRPTATAAKGPQDPDEGPASSMLDSSGTSYW